MTENEKKIAKIFSFIALAAAILKFYPIVCGFGFKILINQVKHHDDHHAPITISHGLRQKRLDQPAVDGTTF